jgi:hypothetical protein
MYNPTEPSRLGNCTHPEHACACACIVTRACGSLCCAPHWAVRWTTCQHLPCSHSPTPVIDCTRRLEPTSRVFSSTHACVSGPHGLRTPGDAMPGLEACRLCVLLPLPLILLVRPAVETLALVTARWERGHGRCPAIDHWHVLQSNTSITSTYSCMQQARAKHREHIEESSL